MHEVPNLKTNKLVIGYSLEALEYSKKTRASLLINGELKPHRYEHPEQHRRWNLLSFELGMAGLQPIPSKIEGIRIEEGVANISTEFYRKIRISFDEYFSLTISDASKDLLTMEECDLSALVRLRDFLNYAISGNYEIENKKR